MTSRRPFFLVMVQTSFFWLLCLVLSYSANNVTTVYLPPTTTATTPISTIGTTSTTAAPPTSTTLSNTRSTDVVTPFQTSQDVQNSSLADSDTEDFHPHNEWTAENIALRVCVLLAISIGLVGIIKLSLIIHRRCATKDELYAQVHTV